MWGFVKDDPLQIDFLVQMTAQTHHLEILESDKSSWFCSEAESTFAPNLPADSGKPADNFTPEHNRIYPNLCNFKPWFCS